MLSCAGADLVPPAILGSVQVTLKANSDTLVSAAFHRPAVFVGELSGDPVVTGGTAEVSWAHAPTGSGEFGAGALVGSHYLIFSSGERSGYYFEIVGNGVDSVEIDLNGAELLAVGGDRAAVIPHWTLGTLIPAGAGFPAWDGSGTIPGEVLLRDHLNTGTNKVHVSTYIFYESGGVGGWIDGLGTPSDDVVVAPRTHFIARNNTGVDLSYASVGQVSQIPHVVQIDRDAVDNDNYLSLDRPVPVTLAESGLAEGMVAFDVSASAFDELIVLNDPSREAKNRAPLRVYLIFNGAWIDGLGNDVSDDPAHAIRPGEGFVIRSKAGVPSTSFAESLPNF